MLGRSVEAKPCQEFGLYESQKPGNGFSTYTFWKNHSGSHWEYILEWNLDWKEENQSGSREIRWETIS